MSEFTYQVLRMTRQEKENLIRELTDHLNIVKMHLSDFPLLYGAVYCKYLDTQCALTNKHIAIINYLIIKYNCNSIGATIESLAVRLETSPIYIINQVQQLIKLELIKSISNEYLGTVYCINKENILNLRSK